MSFETLNTKNYSLVINIPFDHSISTIDIIHCLDTLYIGQNVFYALICHNRDVNDLGDIKTLHWHIVLCLPCRVKAVTIVNDINETLFEGKYKNCIQIKKALSVPAVVKYLDHSQEETKTLYDFNEIITNDKEKLKNYYDSVDNELSYIVNAIKSGASLFDIINFLGLTKYNSMRNTIKDLFLIFGGSYNEKK